MDDELTMMDDDFYDHFTSLKTVLGICYSCVLFVFAASSQKMSCRYTIARGHIFLF